MILLKFMKQIDGSTYVGKMVDEALMEETRRVAILQRMSIIRELIGRRQFARSLGVANHPIFYTRCAPQPPDTEREAVEDKPGPSHPTTTRQTRCRDDDDHLAHDEPRPYQPPVTRCRRCR